MIFLPSKLWGRLLDWIGKGSTYPFASRTLTREGERPSSENVALLSSRSGVTLLVYLLTKGPLTCFLPKEGKEEIREGVLTALKAETAREIETQFFHMVTMCFIRFSV